MLKFYVIYGKYHGNKKEATAMVQAHSKHRQLKLPELESVNRITNIPIVESSWNIAGQVYNRLKKSNNLICWTFDHAESSLYNVVDTAAPVVLLMERPISTIDKIICKSLDLVENKVPSINLPPQMIYFNTKQYVSDVGSKIVKPVLKRADSVKQIGNSVLASKYTAFAADKLDGALDVADKYIEKYLPAEVFDNPGNEEIIPKPIDGPAGKAIQTSQHVYRFSKKLRRRLTRRTMLEAKALKNQSAEAIHVLVYVAELVATDPKLALQKGKELWFSLSRDEPENQARPENLEQLVVLLTRESARRVVHLINFTTVGLGRVPRRASKIINNITQSCVHLLESLMKTIHVDDVRRIIWTEAKTYVQSVTLVLSQLNIRMTDLLEQLAIILSAQKQQTQAAKKPKPATISIMNILPVIPLPPPNSNSQLSSPQDNLRPPTTTKTQIKATHRQANNVSNGESIKSTS